MSHTLTRHCIPCFQPDSEELYIWYLRIFNRGKDGYALAVCPIGYHCYFILCFACVKGSCNLSISVSSYQFCMTGQMDMQMLLLISCFCLLWIFYESLITYALLSICEGLMGLFSSAMLMLIHRRVACFAWVDRWFGAICIERIWKISELSYGIAVATRCSWVHGACNQG